MLTYLKFPQEVQTRSGLHLLGMQVQCEHEHRQDDGGDHPQGHFGHSHIAGRGRETIREIIRGDRNVRDCLIFEQFMRKYTADTVYLKPNLELLLLTKSH